jgi:uncharacterized protein YbgA (DUF1722 family)/uncharacterized protein YbbK (DUF523 family)
VNDSENPSIRIGISSCLLGNRVRFDGGHKEDTFITNTLGAYFEWVAICPEMEIGLGAPRPSLKLVGAAGEDAKLILTKTSRDLTSKMSAYAKQKVKALSRMDLSGFILKKNSPSCGMERVKVYRDLEKDSGPPHQDGVGAFAKVLLSQFPNLPMEEEGRLSDPRLRENWIERVFAYHRLQKMWRTRWGMKDLVAFHTAHKLALLAHSPTSYKELGQLVARARELSRDELKREYEAGLMAAFKKISSRGRNTNVLEHMLGYLKPHIDADAKNELITHISDYRLGHVPLVVPLTLLQHYVRRHNISYLQQQTYLSPHPKELALRNHV